MNEGADFLNEPRAQTAFEYMLIAAAVLLFLVIAVVIIRNQLLAPANSQVSNGVSNFSRQLDQFATTTTGP